MKRIRLWLRVDLAASGLEVGDQVLRLCRMVGGSWEVNTVRLAPGVMTSGKINDREAFLAAVRELKKASFGSRAAQMTVNVVVSLSSASVYNQFFTSADR